MKDADVFVMPESWQFYQADLGFDMGRVVVAAEPRGSVEHPTITLDVTLETDVAKGNAYLYLSANEALEVWTALGHAIVNASGKQPKPVSLIKTDSK